VVARTKKAAEKAKLKQTTSFTITISGAEANIQRIAALLMFADRDKVELNYDDCPMPFDDPSDPKFTGPKPMELDYNTIRKDIVGLLQKYIDAGRVADAKRILGERTLRSVKDDELLPLWETLKLDAGPDA
jgi:hypothetical protein